ncbi:MAG: hypothetical protein ACK53Y_21505, partial [bacterium]
ELFEELWMLVDGIYPSLARFVKPISVPVGKREALFAMWQESKRKDIERFFGVFTGGLIGPFHLGTWKTSFMFFIAV